MYKILPPYPPTLPLHQIYPPLFQRIRGLRERLEVRPVVFIRLVPSVSKRSLVLRPNPFRYVKRRRVTHKGKPAVAARGNLRLVRVDKDTRVSRRAATAVASNDALVRPPDGLLVNELDGRARLGLSSSAVLFTFGCPIHPILLSPIHGPLTPMLAPPFHQLSSPPGLQLPVSI